jgi:predicted P-loop ATPase
MSEADKIDESKAVGENNTKDNVVHIDTAKGKAKAPAPASAAAPKPPPAPSWKARLYKKGKVLYKPNLANALTALRIAPEWTKSLRYNAFSDIVLLDRAPPWHKKGEPWQPRQWVNNDGRKLAEWLQQQAIDVSSHLAMDAALTIAREQEFHPVRDWFASLTWDGTPRLDKWLVTYLGAEDRAFECCVGPKYLISAVARIMEPGCKADCVLMLIGDQGQGKSTALVVLVGEKWFTDEIGALSGDKDTPIAMIGKLLAEFSDLEGFRGKSVEELKAFLSRRANRYRGVFDRLAEDHPRQIVFAATTNKRTPLKDITGNRRFWPILTNSIDLAALGRDREQLWAEAVVRYKAGEKWWLSDKEQRVMADVIAEEFREAGVVEELVEQKLVSKSEIKLADLLNQIFNVSLGKIRKDQEREVTDALEVLGWKRVRKTPKNARRYWAYVPRGLKKEE